MYVTEEEEFTEIPEEVFGFLEREKNTIQSYKEPLEVINLGSEEDPKKSRLGHCFNSI